MFGFLDNRWVSRAGNLSFLVGAVLFLWSYVTEHDPLFVVGVVALVVGVLLMVAPRLGRRLQPAVVADAEAASAPPAMKTQRTRVIPPTPKPLPDLRDLAEIERQRDAPRLAPEAAQIDLSPRALMDLHRGRTALQASQLLKDYRGKRMRVSGQVHSVSDVGGDYLSVTFEEPDQIFMIFDKGHHGHLVALQKGDTVTIEGMLYTVDSTSITLERCRLIAVKGQARGNE